MTKTILLTIAATLALSACDSNSANNAVRNGPQAVHPSPSALAKRGHSVYAPTQPAQAGYYGRPQTAVQPNTTYRYYANHTRHTAPRAVNNRTPIEVYQAGFAGALAVATAH